MHQPDPSAPRVAVSTPSDVTVYMLLSAKLKELQFWVKQANSKAGSRVLTSQGTVKILREKLTKYYGLDLSTTSSTLNTNTAKSKTVLVGLVTMDLQL
jgi:hypothetical protein